MFCFPNSLARLWDNALKPSFPMANAEVVVLSLRLAVAPVKSSVPRLPAQFPIHVDLVFLQGQDDLREKANAAVMLVSTDSRGRRPGRVSRATFQSAAQMEKDGQ
jgi:hypothetical protein